MLIRLLGPVSVGTGDDATAAGKPQQRLVLAVLAAEAGRSVPVDTVIERVWDAAPPPHARRTLHTHIARIRRQLADAGGHATLLHRAGGYLLEVQLSQVDVHRFAELFDTARDPQCPPRRRVQLLREALDLWHGEPLAGLGGHWADRTRLAWTQQRLEAVIAWAQTEIELGNAGATLGALTELAAGHPLMQRLTGVLMRALHATGRTPEALRCYADLRRRLVAELGIEPGPELQELHRFILGGESQAAPAVAPTVPTQLPRDVPGFSGRGAELATLDALVHETARHSGAILVCGMPGVGKTTLAVHWAHGAAHRFPDGQLYVNLRGFEPGGNAVTQREAVRGFLDALGVPVGRVPVTEQAQIGLYRSLISDRRMLIVLDNAADSAQVRQLLPAGRGCLALVTSRSRLTGLVAAEGAQPLMLDLLSNEESRQLLAGRLGAQRVAAQPEAADEIIACCGRLPLALAIAAARAATHPELTLATLAAELRASHTRLTAFDTGDKATDLRTVFSWSYQGLSAAAARLFRLLGLHPGPDIDTWAAASLAGVPVAEVEPLLAELTRAHLIAEHVAGRYRLHDLLRAYAFEQTQAEDPDDARLQATHRMLDHYLHTACAAKRLTGPIRSSIELPDPQPGVTPQELADHTAALEWFNAEFPVMRGLLGVASGHGFDAHAWQLPWTLATFLPRRGLWHEMAASHEHALAAARRLGDKRLQATIHNALGGTHFELDRHDDAIAAIRHALALAHEIGDLEVAAKAYGNLSKLHEELGEYEKALESALSALDSARACGFGFGEAAALNAVGWQYLQLGDYRRTLAFCEQALDLHHALGDRLGAANTLDSIGRAHHHLGEYERAIDRYQEALGYWETYGDLTNQVDALTHIGEAHQALGNTDAARESWQRALHVLDELGHSEADRMRDRLAALA